MQASNVTSMKCHHEPACLSKHVLVACDVLQLQLKPTRAYCIGAESQVLQGRPLVQSLTLLFSRQVRMLAQGRTCAVHLPQSAAKARVSVRQSHQRTRLLATHQAAHTLSSWTPALAPASRARARILAPRGVRLSTLIMRPQGPRTAPKAALVSICKRA